MGLFRILYDALPASGEREYEQYYNELQSSADRRALQSFHSARRAGVVVTRLGTDDAGNTVLYVGRGEQPGEGE